MRLPEAVLIDLDDTIIDDSGSVDICWAEACAEAGRQALGLDPIILRREIDREARWYWSDPERHRAGRLDLRGCTRGIVRRAFRALSYDDDHAAFRVSDYYRDLREERARLFPGAIETLLRLREEGVRLGLMTNGAGPAQRAKIGRFGLDSCFDAVVIEGEFGVGKPDHRVYQALIAGLGVDAAGAWAVGDNLEFDVLAPMQMGVFGVWVDGSTEDLPHPGRCPDRTIETLSQLLD